MGKVCSALNCNMLVCYTQHTFCEKSDIMVIFTFCTFKETSPHGTNIFETLPT